jgi:hypothetical protein
MEFTAQERVRIDSISKNSEARDMKTSPLPNHKKVGLEKLQPPGGQNEPLPSYSSPQTLTTKAQTKRGTD